MMHMFLQRYLGIILNVAKLGSLQNNKGMILFFHLCSSRLMGLSQSYALCFVIDTTGSMADDINAAKQVAFNIIDSNAGTLQEPSQYILVPFNDPGTSTFMDIPHVAKESQQTKHIYSTKICKFMYFSVPQKEFGPVIKTTDKNYFKKEINKLTASGGGDEPEMSMSGLRVSVLVFYHWDVCLHSN